MIEPRLNLNGSSATDLIQPRVAARDALSAAIDALMRAAPHGRDYPGDSERCEADRALHFERIGRLAIVRAELLSEAIAIKNQQ